MQNDNTDSLARVIEEMRKRAKFLLGFANDYLNVEGDNLNKWADRLAALRQVPEDAAAHIAAQAGAELPEWEDGDSPEALAIACECIYQAASTYDTFDQLPKAAALIRRLTGAHGFPALPETRFAMNGARLYTADQMHAYAREAKRLAALKAQGVEGYVLVPREPTPAMRAAGERERLSNPTNMNPYHVWAAMLAAAPAPAVGADARRFRGVGELERTGYIPEGSAAEREAAKPSAPAVSKVDPAMCTHKFMEHSHRCLRCGWDFTNGDTPPDAAKPSSEAGEECDE